MSSSQSYNLNTLVTTYQGQDPQGDITEITQASQLSVKNLGLNVLKSIPVAGFISDSNRLASVGNSGFLVNLGGSIKQSIMLDSSGKLTRIANISNSANNLLCSAWNPLVNRILQAQSDNVVYQLDQTGAVISGQNITVPSTPTAMAVSQYPWGNTNSSLYVACDSNKTIYNMYIGGGNTVYFSFPYPTGLTSCYGITTDGYTVLLADGGNTLYRVNATTGTLIETISLPVQCDGGIAYDMITNQFFVADGRKQTIFEIPLGGGTIDIASKHISYFKACDLFAKQSTNIITPGQEPTIMYENGTFKLWYSKSDSNGTNEVIAYATSNDGITFSTPQTVIGLGVGGETNQARGSYVIKVGSTYHIFYCTGIASANIVHATSTDGINWTGNTTIATYTAIQSAWSACNGSMGNIGIFNDGTQWVMWLEVQMSGNGNWAMGRLTSPDLTTWTIDSTFPRITAFLKNSSIGGPQPWMQNGKYYMLAHESLNGTLPTLPVLLYSKDGLNWSKAPANPLLNWTDINEVDQIVDQSWIEINGKIYLYYAANDNVAGQTHFNIALATANTTINQLLGFMNV